MSDRVPPSLDELRHAIRAAGRRSEAEAIGALIERLSFDPLARRRAREQATSLVAGARARAAERPLLDSFLAEFGLSNQEGIALMCLAEALLRIPDDETADRLIAEKIAAGDWQAHEGSSSSLFVNASTWGLMLTGRIVDVPNETRIRPGAWLQGLAQRAGEPLIRGAFRRAMRIIGGEFVVGRDIEEALARSREDPALALCSYDMLGEGARTAADAARYLAAYEHALEAIGRAAAPLPTAQRSTLSIKLSALDAGYRLRQRTRVLERLLPRVQALARRAASLGIGLTIDAEEAERLDLSLDVIAALAADPATRPWDGLGLAIQAYGLRVLPLIEWLGTLARAHARRLNVRLVKGAYWDAEIKRAQELGLANYPVYTRKTTTDLSYLVAAGALFAQRDALYPQFATHNAHTIASVLELRPSGAPLEFQRLHGMGGLLYDEARRQIPEFPAVRAYAPVGRHEDLLAYLVRRLLENGANTSFVNRFMDERVPIDAVVVDPVEAVVAAGATGSSSIPLPERLYGASRLNSRGVDFGDPDALARLARAASVPREAAAPASVSGPAVLPGADPAAVPIRNPADRRELVGESRDATPDEISRAFERAAAAQDAWDAAGGEARAQLLLRTADALAAERAPLLRLLVREAGKTLADAIAELREAEDFCRYYAAQARERFAAELPLPGPTGERNTLRLRGRGVFACISPWNFPLAIFLGQVTAALAAGNAVVAKPAEATPLIAAAAVRLLHAAGVPAEVLQLTPSAGPAFGEVAFAHPSLAGVALTGSTATALRINRALAAREGPILPFIAETGGLNAMIVDSSALPEQVVDDAISSAFASAGQRCSALRLLFVQEDIADRLIDMLVGAMDELAIGDPADPATDVGPVIDERARSGLEAHAARMRAEARVLREGRLDERHAHGSFFAPRLYELRDARQLQREVFGPILHLVRWRAGALDAALAAVRASGYGLTLGVHSRIEGVWEDVVAGTRVGNTYVNRNMIGAVVGVQPFGGEGLSGTGPKAGGPNYLPRFAVERTLTINTVATGGNAQLLASSS